MLDGIRAQLIMIMDSIACLTLIFVVDGIVYTSFSAHKFQIASIQPSCTEHLFRSLLGPQSSNNCLVSFEQVYNRKKTQIVYRS